MKFLVQFKKYRRGVPEVIATLPIAATDGAAALALVQSLTGKRRWPPRTDALRLMDDGGRTLIDWTIPAASAQPVTCAFSNKARRQRAAPSASHDAGAAR
jgi:hypothetical protein